MPRQNGHRIFSGKLGEMRGRFSTSQRIVTNIKKVPHVLAWRKVCRVIGKAPKYRLYLDQQLPAFSFMLAFNFFDRDLSILTMICNYLKWEACYPFGHALIIEYLIAEPGRDSFRQAVWHPHDVLGDWRERTAWEYGHG